MSREGIYQILKQFSEGKLLDSRIVNVLFENYDEIFSYVAGKQAAVRGFYEKKFTFTEAPR